MEITIPQYLNFETIPTENQISLIIAIHQLSNFNYFIRFTI
jgi:hypothetical protein